jgi:hypothetical protein
MAGSFSVAKAVSAAQPCGFPRPLEMSPQFHALFIFLSQTCHDARATLRHRNDLKNAGSFVVLYAGAPTRPGSPDNRLYVSSHILASVQPSMQEPALMLNLASADHGAQLCRS